MWKKLRPIPIQQEYWQDNSRWITCCCGRRSGKSDITARKLILSAVKHKGNYVALTPTQAQTNRVLNSFCEELIPPSIGVYRRSLSRWDLVNGSRIHLLSGEALDRVDGMTPGPRIIWVDECSDIYFADVYTSLIPALGDMQGKLWLTGVPKRRGKGAVEYQALCKGRNPDFHNFSWPSSIVLPPDELETVKKTLTPAQFAEQYEASWETDTAMQVYYSFSKANVIPTFEPRATDRIYCSFDWNINPNVAILGAIRPEDGTYTVFKEFYLPNTNTASKAVIVGHYLRENFPDFVITCVGDATGYARKSSSVSTDWALIESHFNLTLPGKYMLRCRVPNPRVDVRIAVVNALLCNAAYERKLFITQNCNACLIDMNMLMYNDKGQVDTSIATLGHLSDAIGYFCMVPVNNASADVAFLTRG